MFDSSNGIARFTAPIESKNFEFLLTETSRDSVRRLLLLSARSSDWVDS